MELKKLVTEQRNPNTMHIDTASALEIVTLINREDKLVALAVEKTLDRIAQAVDVIANAIANGGRLIYCGAGTSGRLGVLDASECPPTYGVSNDVVIGLMAGGMEAITAAVEGAEDSLTLCKEDLMELTFTARDVLVGIAASGRTPYVIGGFAYAKEVGAVTVCVTCNPDTPMAKLSDIPIEAVTGPEAVTGSTRMKAGTAQKMVLNMLSTATMIKLGKVYSNLMVDVRTSNEKLVDRANRIVAQATGVSYEQAQSLLLQTNNDVKLAICMQLCGIGKQEAQELLAKQKGHIGKAVENQ